jgi:phage shock protein A
MTRINRIIKANVNDLFNRWDSDSPKEFVRDLESNVSDIISQRRNLDKDLTDIDSDIQDRRQEASRLEENASSAVEEDDTETARAKLSERRRVMNELQRLVDEKDAILDQQRRLGEALDNIRDKIASVEQQLGTKAPSQRPQGTSGRDLSSSPVEKKTGHSPETFDTDFVDEVLDDAEAKIDEFEANLEAERQLQDTTGFDGEFNSEKPDAPDDLADLKKKFEE